MIVWCDVIEIALDMESEELDMRLCMTLGKLFKLSGKSVSLIVKRVRQILLPCLMGLLRGSNGIMYIAELVQPLYFTDEETEAGEGSADLRVRQPWDQSYPYYFCTLQS